SRIFAAPQRARHFGERAPVLFCPPGGGAARSERLPAGLWGRRPAALSPGDDGERMAVCLRPGSDQFPPAGAAPPRGFGVPLSGGRTTAGLLDLERLSPAPPQGPQRSVHPGVGVG